MNERQNVSTTFSVVMALTILAAIILFAIDLFTAGPTTGSGIWTLMFFISATCAFGYGIYGCRKDEQRFFRVACISYAVFSFASIVFFCNEEYILIVAGSAVGLAASTVLAVANNLGKAKSLILTIIMLVASLAGVVVCAGKESIAGPLGCSLLALSFVFMVFAKYQDKKARGSK